MRLTIHIIAITFSFLLLSGCSGNSKDRIEASGTIEGTDVNIGSEVAGRVKEVRVDEGTRVSKGDTLVIIDDREYQIQLRQAAANEEAAEAQYRLALEGSRREDVLQAEATFRNTEADYQRMKTLLASQTITQKQYDDAEARYVSAKQTYEKLVRGLRSEEVSAIKAKRDQATAQADQLRKKLHDCTILSPTLGIVTLRGVEPGELVGIGSNVLRVTYLEKVKLTIYVNETDLPKVQLGQNATVTVDAFKNRTFEGTVIYKSPVAEFTPKNVQTKEERTKLVYAVKIQVENPDGALSPGLPADATLSTQR